MNVLDKKQKLLVIVESPNKVHTVAEIFKELGYEKTTVMASVGHTTQIKDKYGSYKNTGIYPKDNFRVEWEIDPEKYSIIEKLRAQARVSDLVLIASDPDREGESLGNHVKNLLNLADNQYYRIKYHSITKSDIEKALTKLEKMDEALCDAAESRQIVDKMIGYALSPVAKAYVGAKSVGRCQSAGLKLITDREREIQNFVPEYYYDLYLNFTKNAQDFQAKYIGTSTNKIDKIKSTEELNSILHSCKGPYSINNIEKKLKKEQPKPPFCTATFQQEAATRLSLKVKDAMSCAQKLFESGKITYMRTDATTIAKDFLPKLKSYITQHFGAKAYQLPVEGKKDANAQEGHEALRVTDLELTPELFAATGANELLVKVYRLIWQRTVAAALPAAEFSETVYTITDKDTEYLFTLAYKELVAPGYQQIYGKDCLEDKVHTELFSLHEEVENANLQEQQKQTQPPARYKEATLIKELQKRGIGRPSTYVTIVETVLNPNRGYCELIDKIIMPTDRGMQLTSFLDRAFSEVINLDYTRQLEEALDDIANRRANKLTFLQQFYNTLELAISANKENAEGSLQLESKICPDCGADMIVRRSRYGKLFYGCSRYPKCRSTLGID